jgi:chloramphenicol 3-O phosphotransferase
VIVLNGSSSSVKSGIAQYQQAVLPEPWLAIGVDTLPGDAGVLADAGGGN